MAILYSQFDENYAGTQDFRECSINCTLFLVYMLMYLSQDGIWLSFIRNLMRTMREHRF